MRALVTVALTCHVAQKYHVRERAGTIYASSSDERVSHMAGRGDVNAGRAWRTVRRPSDMVISLTHTYWSSLNNICLE